MAMSMISHYPDQTALVGAMVDLAVEEIIISGVMRLILARKLTPGADLKTLHTCPESPRTQSC